MDGRILAFTAALMLGGGAAVSAPLTVEETFRPFNAVTAGDFRSSQEVEGRLYVGGNLTGNTIQVGFNGVAPSPLDEAIVRGSTTIGTINMQNGSDLTVGGNVASNVNMNGGSQGTRTARIGGTQTSGTFNTGTKLVNQSASDPAFAARFPEIDFARFADESDYLAALPGTALSFSDQNRKTINGAATATPLTVFSVTMSQLAGGTWFIDSKLSGTIVINVSGTTGGFSGNVNNAQSNPAAARIVWNFYQATNLDIGTAIIGAILAPRAHLTNFAGSTEGSVIAKSIDLSNGEIHGRGFLGELPEAAPVSEVPLPATLPLLAGALAGVVVLRSRLRRAA